MQQLCEQNGKPCCINLITEADNKFLASLETVQKPGTADAQSRPSTHHQQTKDDVASNQNVDDASLADQQRLDSAGLESNMLGSAGTGWIEDEVDIRIREEEDEKARCEKEIAEKTAKEEKQAKERSQKDSINKAKLEKIKE